jgi:[ribosomal protein S5]-alanine N-acetyltransferase
MFLGARIETESIYTAVSEKNFYQYIPEEIPTREDVEKIIKWSMEQNKKNTHEKIYKFNLSIIHKEDNRIIGYCGLGPDDLKMGEIELYCGISSLYRKQGLAIEAARAIVQYGFEVIGLPKIIAFTDERNQPSIKILVKLGMNYHFKIRNLLEDYKDFEGQCYYTLIAEEYCQTLR